jgi:hypothetical protein
VRRQSAVAAVADPSLRVLAVDVVDPVAEVQMKPTGSRSCQTKWDGSQFSPNASRCPIASRVRTVVQ